MKRLFSLVALFFVFGSSFGQNYALDFDGSDDLVRVANPGDYDFTSTDKFTLEAWIKFDGGSSIKTIVGKKTAGGETLGYAFYVNFYGTEDNKLIFEGTNSYVSSTGTIPLNTWTHVAVTYDQSNVTFYINGTASGGGTVNLQSSSNPIAVGSFGGGSYFFFDGSIDEIRIWDDIRTNNEILNNQEVDVTSSSNLKLYYKFNENTGTTTEDFSNSGNDGTLQNFALSGNSSNWVQSVVFGDILEVQVPVDANYSVGQTLSFNVVFNDDVTVTGAPRLPVVVDNGGTVYAEYVEGSGTDTLTFEYTIRAGLADSDGISLGSNIDLNSGSIKDSTTADIDTQLNNVPSLSNVRIGGLFAYEPFAGQSEGTLLTGTSGGTGLNGSWITLPTTGSASKVAISSTLSDNSDNFEYPSNVNFSIDSGNLGKVRYNTANGSWYPSSNARELAYPIDLDAEGILYVSFLFRDQVATLPTVDGQAMMGFSTGVPASTSDSSEKAILFGYSYQDKMSLDIGPANLMAFLGSSSNSYTASSTSTFPGNPGGKSYFMVGKITTTTSGNTEFKLKSFTPTDNVPLDEATIVWDVTHSENLSGYDLTHLLVQLESKGLSELDEVRVGSNYFDVVGLTPSAPQSVEVTSSSTSATVAFNAPASGTTGLTGYIVVATSTDGLDTVSASGVSSPITVSGLNSSKTYDFKVAAINAAGIGAYGYPTPSITSISPSSGLASGGSTVTISGENFRQSSSVSFGSNNATNVTVIDSNTITVTVPAGTAGDTTIKVTGDTGVSNSVNYTYITAGSGNLKIVESGGDSSGSTWEIISGQLITKGSDEAKVDVSVVETALASDDFSLVTEGYISIDTNLDWSTDSGFTLQSAGNIFFNSVITADNDDASIKIYHGGSNSSTAANSTYDYIFNLANNARIEMTGSNASVHIANEAYSVINSIADLANISTNSSARVVLTDDIDLSATTYTDAVITTAFEGVFEGFGNELQNLKIRNSGGSQTNLGFFSEARGATIRDLGVTEMDIFTSSTSNSTEYRIGGIVGNIGQASLTSGYSKTAYTTTLNGVWTSGKIATANTDPITTASDTDKQRIFFAGGLVGNINNGTAVITRSYSTADVSSAGSEISGRLSVGGLIGDAGNYDKTRNSTTVKLVLDRSYSTGSILTAHHSSGYYGTGGLVGVVYVTDSSISNCYSWSNVVSQDVSYGGIAGYQLTGASSINSYTTLSKKGNGSFPSNVYASVTAISPTSGTNLPTGFSETYWTKEDGKLPRLKELTYPRTALYVKVDDGKGPVGNIFPTYTIVNESGNAVDLAALGLTTPTGTALYTIDNNTPAGTYSDVAYLGGLTLNGANKASYILRPYSSFATYIISASAPNINSFSPSSASVGAQITLTGVNFTNVNGVKIDGITSDFTINSDTSITVTIPEGVESGVVSVSTPSDGNSTITGLSILIPKVTVPAEAFYPTSSNGLSIAGFEVSGYTSTANLRATLAITDNPGNVTFDITSTTGVTRDFGFNSWTGITNINFTGNLASINAALASMKLNTSGVNMGEIGFSLVVSEVVPNYYYNYFNGHYYEFVSTPSGISYDNAKAGARARTFQGEEGYLVSITSAAEQEFVNSKIDGDNIWIGLSDSGLEGEWRIDDGPEEGTLIWKSTVARTNDYTSRYTGGSTIEGQYANWCGSEPNNADGSRGGEDHAVTNWNGGTCWNDLNGNNSSSIGGYVVEYGTGTSPQTSTFESTISATTTFVQSDPINDSEAIENDGNIEFVILGNSGDAIQLFVEGITATGGGVDFEDAIEVSVDNGTTWTTYSNYVAFPSSGVIKARLEIVDDLVIEDDETLKFSYKSVSNSISQGAIYDAEYQTISLDNLSQTTDASGYVGDTYKKTNAITIDGQAIDAVIEIKAASNVTSYTFDNDGSNASRFQSEINSSSNNGSYIEYEIKFFKSGTTDQVFLKGFSVSGVDVDGPEYVELSAFDSYELDTSTKLAVTEPRDGFFRFTRPDGNSLSGISFENTSSFITYYSSPVHSFTFRKGNTTSSSSQRLFSLTFGAPAGSFSSSTPQSSDDLISVTGTIIDNDENPATITGVATKTINEGTTAVATYSTDQDVTWSLSGDDAALFAISSAGELTFIAAPDFENPQDDNTDNDYEVTVTATNASTNVTTLEVTVTVADVDEIAPTITGLATKTINEGTTAVQTFTADETVTWSKVAGADSALFTLSDQGVLSFTEAPDYEDAQDTDENNTYVLTVRATDAAGNTTDITVTVTVADVDEIAPTITGLATKTINEGTTAVQTFTADETVTWSISGTDASLFTIDSSTGALVFNAAPDYEKPADDNEDNDYIFVVTATDTAANTSTLNVTVTVANVIEDADGDGVEDAFDLCSDTLEGKEVDEDGCALYQKDTDNDGVNDEEDAFPTDPDESVDTDGDGVGNNEDFDDDGDGVSDTEDAFPLDSTETVDTDGDGTGNNADTDDDGDGTPDTEDAFPLDPLEAFDADGDGLGDNADPDDDNDGVEDIYDACPNTAPGTAVDINGCDLLIIPAEDFKVAATSATCSNTNDGEILIEALDQTHEYRVTVTGQSTQLALNATSGYAKTITGLSKGTYQVCFTVVGDSIFKQCFTVYIDQPEALQVVSSYLEAKQALDLQIDGATEYYVELNGVLQTRRGSRISLALQKGMNRVKIYTDLDCQGVIEEEVFVSEQLEYAPNPVQDNLNLYVGGNDSEVKLTITDLNGVLIETREVRVPASRIYTMNMSRYTEGVYILTAEGVTVRKTIKVVKR